MLIELEYPEPKQVSLPAGKTLLVIVDMAKETCDPAGRSYHAARGQMVPVIAELRRRVREAGGLVIHTQSVRTPDQLEFTVFNNVIRHLEGTWDVEFVEALTPASDEPVVVKRTHDCFYKTDMEEGLERLGIRPGDGRVIITGTAARGCVQCAVMGFSIRDYYVYTPMDCIAQTDPKDALQAFSLYTNFGYRYNVTPTMSSMISLMPDPTQTPQIRAEEQTSVARS